MKLIVTLIFTLPSIFLFAQVDIKVSSIIDGKWKIEHRGKVVSDLNPEAGLTIDYSKEIISKTDSIIEFTNSFFKLNGEQKGNYNAKSYSFTLNNVKYNCGVYSKDKVSLTRFITPEVLLQYMLIRISED